MVNFGELRRARSTTKALHPKDIFLRLPKPLGVDDLWQSQAEALEEWFDRRDQQDLVIKLNTGGGKTLVGLLMAQSTLAEKGGPVIFLCATNQLSRQTISHASLFGIPVVPFVSGTRPCRRIPQRKSSHGRLIPSSIQRIEQIRNSGRMAGDSPSECNRPRRCSHRVFHRPQSVLDLHRSRSVARSLPRAYPEFPPRLRRNRKAGHI